MPKYNLPYESFMEYGYIETKLCDDIIKFFNDFKHRATPGNVGTDARIYKDLNSKDSLDISLNMNQDLFNRYSEASQKVLNKYMNRYTFVKEGSLFSNTVETTNIQYYKPGGGFKKWHSERHSLATTKRLLVFMTYLNDVPKGGTEFYYQKIKTEAKKGLTLMWPADWTHTHRGIVSKTHEKYIVTGWYSYC
jgi:hypothetical protein|tara:strand:- start:1266 stop:1841 length:576 start_codon:yes stop_codon:yes gene_type:complete